MKKYKEMISELTVMQRMKKNYSQVSKNYKNCHEKPPSPEIQNPLNRELRQNPVDSR